MIPSIRSIAAALLLAATFVAAPARAALGPARSALDPARSALDDGTKPAQEKKPVAIYDENADVKELIRAAEARAKRENRRVLVQWGGNWCVWCRRLHELCSNDRSIAKELFYEYDIVYADSLKGDKNVELASSFGADLKKNGVPFLTVLDADGKVLANQETSALETKVDGQGGHDPKKVLEFLTQHQAPPLDAGEVWTAALARAKSQEKRVFLHFGAPWCGWCRKLEAWMAKPEIETIVGKDFIDVKIDVDRTVGGKDLMARFRGKGASIPWFALVDADGRVIADSGRGDDNLGFPSTAAEIDAFASMLEKARAKITPADVETLKRSLAPPPKEAAKQP
jgi:thiol-disulfide isomerase/thioredoxin